MRKLIAALAVGLALLAWHAEVQAACTTHTYFLPGGRMVTCTTCCFPYGGGCTTSCI